MASTYTPLGVELMATGEKAGTWGTKTNTNLQIIEQISGGYIEQAIAGNSYNIYLYRWINRRGSCTQNYKIHRVNQENKL